MNEKKTANLDLYVSQKEYFRRTYEKGGDPPWDNAFDSKWLIDAAGKLRVADGKTALEVGAGHGRGASILAESGFRTVGLDYLAEPLEVAESKKGKSAGPLYVQADIFAPPFPDDSFDLILDWGVFHHVLRKDATAYVKSLSRLLKKEGRFLLGCFAENFRHKGERARKRNWTRHQGHYDRFSTKEELFILLKPFFLVNSLAEDEKGFYLIDMSHKGKKR